MNRTVKNPSEDPRTTQLKEELYKSVAPTPELDTGTRHVQEGSHWSRNTHELNTHFHAKQGRRLTEHSSLLHEFPAIGKAHDTWTQAMDHEDKRAHVDPHFEVGHELDGITTQLGVVTRADQEFKERRKQGKLSRLYAVGV